MYRKSYEEPQAFKANTEKLVTVSQVTSDVSTARSDSNDRQTLKYTREEKAALVRKFDYRITAFLSVLYLFAFLDRSNIGNAHTAGLTTDLNISDSQYQWLLTIFYIAYICGQTLTLVWKAFSPKRYLFVVVMSWGIVATCQAAAFKWASMMVLRFLLGVFEAGYGPGVPYYLTRFYFRHEVTYRVAAFMLVPPIASAFAGALAYGITYHRHAIESWRILFIVEGFPPCVLAVLCLWLISNSPSEMKSLTNREKEIAAARGLKQTGPATKEKGLRLADALQSLLDFKNVCSMILFFCVNVAFSALPIYLPTLVHTMGYTSVNAQGLSAPPYIAAAFCTMLAAWVSERSRQRGLVISFCYVLAAVGYIILIVARSRSVRYFATYLCCCGIYPIVANLFVWNLQGRDSKTGLGYVLMSLVGQCGPLLGTRLFPVKDAPYYKKGGWVSVGCLLTGACTALALRSYFVYKNRQFDKKYGKPVCSAKRMIQDDFEDLENGNKSGWDADNVGLEATSNRNFRYHL